VAAAKERLDVLHVELASIEGNIARLASMLEDDTISDDEYATVSRQRVHALTAKRYCTVEMAWLQVWLRVNDPDTTPRMLRAIFMELVQIKSILGR
jgi:hypothetical protein